VDYIKWDVRRIPLRARYQIARGQDTPAYPVAPPLQPRRYRAPGRERHPVGDNAYGAMSSQGFPLAARAAASERARFVRQTYGYLALAAVAFAAVEWVLLRIPGIHRLADVMTRGYDWLLTLVAFMVVASLADRWARSGASRAMQCLGFAVYLVAEAVLFVPLLLGVAAAGNASDVLPTAGVLTFLLAAGLTGVVAVTRADFSFLRSALTIGGFLALGLIVAGILIGFNLGLWFALATVVFAAASLLYHTTGVLQTSRTDQPVAAALALVASIALLFWYVVQIVRGERHS